METRTGTRTFGSLTVAPVCLGGNVFGWTADETTTFDILDAFTAGGGNFIDTADSYSAWVAGHSGGESETLIGRWLAKRGRRDDVVVATKLGAHPQYKGLAPATIRAAAEASLRRLGTDRIDLLYTHFDDESVPVSDIITELDALVREGKVREIAASNISPERLEASLTFSAAEHKARYVALQPHYNLVSRNTYEGPLAEVAARHNLACVPYFALARGFLTGKYRPDGPAVDSPRAASASSYLDTPQGLRVLAALDEVAEARSAEVATVALAWLAAQPTVAAPIASARTTEQLQPLLASLTLDLTPADLAALTEASTP
ncbi:aldo/keto reductase [Streptomyces aidingensis]|uniref:Predicted oxidoreductase n=1 Tax=Streptomyces aidingensis TaxID=910347 RepID=A0A1I1TUD4_9ACTN|nr:aldo/keto reductase [Streptomyces aidingensis]SFD62261.1 Predicted oxidoreductase [Streptomyces aidingensis]